MPRIVRFYETGEAEVLKIDEMEAAEPGKGEVRLKVEAIGLNRAEIMYRRGQYLETPELPSRIGYEAAGIVDAVGPEVEGIRVGDRVSIIPSFPMGRYGVYGDSATVPASAAAHYPDTLSPVEATTIWMQYLTAYGALVAFGRLRKGETILITAASSSVGQAAIQIAKSVGALVAATTRTHDKRAFLLNQGVDQVIVTDEEDMAERVRQITSGKGADFVFDPVAGPFLAQSAKAAAAGARIFVYGALSPEPTTFPLFEAIGKGLSIRGYTLFEIVRDAEMLALAKHYVRNGLTSGALKPVIDRTFDLTEIVEAHRYMESNRQQGKIVVTVSPA